MNEYICDRYSLYNGDCCEVMMALPDNSMDFSIFSPPFVSLYVYSDSERDMGNCHSEEDFFEHFGYCVKELYRILVPGRLVAIHCMDMPRSKANFGDICLYDFPGDIIRAFENQGFLFHSRVTIWKDPVVAMARTHAIGLLHKQLKKDASLSRQGCADYLIVMRKPAETGCQKPVEHKDGINPKTYIGEDTADVTTPVEVWQKYASPVWSDIRQSRTLNYKQAKADDDERHICPLQLDVVERAIQLWTNPDDVVFTPFLGVGTEVYCAVKMGRRGVGIELKPDYFEQSLKNVHQAYQENSQKTLLDLCQR